MLQRPHHKHLLITANTDCSPSFCGHITRHPHPLPNCRPRRGNMAAPVVLLFGSPPDLKLSAERNHGRKHPSHLTASSRKKKLAKLLQSQTQAVGAAQAGQERRSRKGLAYEVVEVGEDEVELFPICMVDWPLTACKFGAAALGILSSFVASEPAETRTQCFARKVSLGYCRRHSSGLNETTVNGELDLFTDDVNWASEVGDRGEVEELHERLVQHSQRYTKPSPAIVGTTAYASVGPLLPLGSRTLTQSVRHLSTIPIVVVCATTDHMDNAAEDVGVKGGHWKEKTDRAQQVLRTVCLAYGAALYYTAPTQPTTYALLKSYLLHRLYTVPPPLIPPPTSPNTVSAPAIVGSTIFPFNHRANALDRDAVLVPSGWDSWGKIDVLRDGSDTALVEKGWKVSLSNVLPSLRVESLKRIMENLSKSSGRCFFLPSYPSPLKSSFAVNSTSSSKTPTETPANLSAMPLPPPNPPTFPLLPIPARVGSAIPPWDLWAVLPRV
ncbi:hypothetical protein L202_00955 [Cryptococcus amylolentus CBS 6039]|uniref:Uncharacterized protein n=1 Tax=Cryptococcus amylolentus CBS 6039 TaxID=1295533 RepID=A0A1E3I2C4_9TREE|nr:hypothetical protein L202_00955 [Cryptococcus amylolentus CBS 6039]ODN82658.1 hypothetical protein L202_00955 [Cryptococcus amylolentus CBS 6039]